MLQGCTPHDDKTKKQRHHKLLLLQAGLLLIMGNPIIAQPKQVLWLLPDAEVSKHRIKANSIAPGLIMNDFLKRIYPPEFFEEAIKKIPVGRARKLEDIANAIVFMVSDESSYMIGESMSVCGGFYMK